MAKKKFSVDLEDIIDASSVVVEEKINEAALAPEKEEAKNIPAETPVDHQIIEESVKPLAAPTVSTSRAGRPKGKPSSKISFNLPDEDLEYVGIAAGINFKGNTSNYIVALIEKDIATNKALYDQMLKLKNS